MNPGQSNIRVNVTVQKSNIKNKVKEFKRCQQTEITRSVNRRSGTNAGTSINDGLNHSALYGIRVQDREICLNHPDATDIVAVLESLDTNTPVLDKITFTSTDDIFTEAIIGEKISGEDSKAIARVVSIDSGNNQISVVYLTDSKFTLLETLDFEESNAVATVQALVPGKYNNVTSSYMLDKGQKNQYYDYSRIVRNAGAFVPHRKLLIIYNRYDVPSSDTGDIFTVNSYDAERYKTDIPAIGPSRTPAHDVLDFRPQVPVYDPVGATVSPFFFTARDFTGKPDRLLTPNESVVFDYDFYLPRIDKLVLHQNGEFLLLRGTPSRQPLPPESQDKCIEIATLLLPAFLIFKTKS